jgi:hypothetical protein
MRKPVSIALAAALTIAAGASAAQALPAVGEPYDSPAQCIADYSRLDTNHDGRIDTKESEKYPGIRENVDVNGDGIISGDESTVACKKGLARAFHRNEPSAMNFKK